MGRSDIQQAVQGVLDGVTQDPQKAPGIVFVAVDKNGDTLTANASGHRSVNGKKPMDLDTIFWIASCTKLLATIACLQLVEQGKLHLDDPKHLYQHVPEIEKLQVLQDDSSLKPREGDITLRQLLSHTAGFGYSFFNKKLRDFGRPMGIDEFDGDVDSILNTPLVNQPGSRWEYGTNIDWAGIYAERVSGMTLNDLLQKNILEPLGLKNINMFPTPSMKENLASMHQRWPGSTELSERDHPWRKPLLANSPEAKKQVLNSGGAGCYARPTEYVQVLATLLNDGKHPKSGVQILKKETVEEMFKNQIPDFPDFARQHIEASKPEWSNSLPELYPQAGNPPQGWGLSFHLLIEPGPTGRGANSVNWAGIANLFYWIDREKGVAGMIASQVLPFGDPHVMGAWGMSEAMVYQNLGDVSEAKEGVDKLSLS
ncbi:beta-lactamase/transpeptidase-like protein [Elsinoe ampelina]|uniref:Beta-lactamase/transpeptidase-like protein n=1 Tax=Elsinoe ampelina TaxID=302913 RepID=A0A6A6GGF4_9PEZI|nr:beta-lactamase/transpeptidase-like protein [Elsinoe ampelina]